MVSIRQSSFAGGLVGPQLLGRADMAKYQAGLRTLRNFIVTRNGTLENRSGTLYTGATSNGANPVRMIKFGSSVGQGLLLEFGNLYVRFFKNGAPVRSATSSGAWSGATTYARSAIVTFSGVTYLSLQASNLNHQPDVSPTYWYVQSSTVLQVPTIIPQAALAQMQVVQINDLMYIASQAFAPQVLSHFADTDWTAATFAQSTGIPAPGNVSAVAGTPSSGISTPGAFNASGGASGTPIHEYAVTAFRLSDNTQSAPNFAGPVGAAAGGTPVSLSWGSVGGADGYALYRTNVANQTPGLIAILTGTSYTDSGSIGGTFGARMVAQLSSSTGGSQSFVYVVTAVSAVSNTESLASTTATTTGGTPSSSNPNVISWDAVAGAASYNIYKSSNGVFGFIGSSSQLNFNDNNIIPATSQQPPVAIPLFQTTNDYPAVVGSYQQRLLFANTINQPQTVWASAVGVFTNFTTAIPVLDSGAIQFTIAGRVRQYVQALVDIGKLIIHTSNGEYVALGNQFNSITPTAINLVQHGYAGAALLVPVSIGSAALFVQARGNIIRDLEYSIRTTTFSGKDVTLYAPHLFENQTITQMDWQQVYNSIIWAVQSNGTLLGLTYIKDQEMWAWHQHDTQGGVVEQVCVVPEGTQDVVYLVVKRTINGSVSRSIERMQAREFVDTVNLSDAVFTDCSLIYDGRNTGSTTLTATTITGGWTPQDTLTLTASASTFASSDVGNEIVFQQTSPITGLVTASLRCSIIAYTSATSVKVQPQGLVPSWIQGVALTTWGKAVHQFSGMSQLEGQAISALGDGSVAFNALTDQVPTVVTGGAFTTSKNYLVLCAGLPITGQVQTLPWEGGGRTETMGNKQQRVIEMTVVLYGSRGGLFGQDFAHLYPWKQRGLQNENMGANPALFTGPAIVPIQGTWQTTAQVCVQQTDPLPMGISAVIPTGEEGN